MARYVLSLDVGGTNPRMAMVKINKENDYQIVVKRSIDRNQKSIIPDMNDFLKECRKKGIKSHACCASVAGPVDTQRNECRRPTNTKFPVVGKEIISKTPLKDVLVINDFKAIGEAVASIDLKKRNRKVIQIPGVRDGKALKGKPGFYPKPDPSGNRGVIGPGTGLGVSYIVNTPNGYYVSPSEGCHAGFPVRGDYSPLYNFIRKKLRVEQVGMEALVSGQGIRHIIDFFITEPRGFRDIVEANPSYRRDVRGFGPEKLTDRDIRRAMLGEKRNPLKADVAQMVAEGTDKNPKARIAMRLFMEFLGNAAQAVALHGLTTGGLFIAGGIPAKNQSLFEDGGFMRSFCDNWKPNIRQLMSRIPVYLVTDYDTTFYGCARVADSAFWKK
jgi:glucokinase